MRMKWIRNRKRTQHTGLNSIRQPQHYLLTTALMHIAHAHTKRLRQSTVKSVMITDHHNTTFTHIKSTATHLLPQVFSLDNRSSPLDSSTHTHTTATYLLPQVFSLRNRSVARGVWVPPQTQWQTEWVLRHHTETLLSHPWLDDLAAHNKKNQKKKELVFRKQKNKKQTKNCSSSGTICMWIWIWMWMWMWM